MHPLYEDPGFTFRFAEARIIPRIHLEGVAPGCRVTLHKIDPATGQRLVLLATASMGDGGWVDLPEPIVVNAGDAFIAVCSERGEPTWGELNGVRNRMKTS